MGGREDEVGTGPSSLGLGISYTGKFRSKKVSRVT